MYEAYIYIYIYIDISAATTAARHHIWSPGVSVASISQYLLVFYKLFLRINLK